MAEVMSAEQPPQLPRCYRCGAPPEWHPGGMCPSSSIGHQAPSQFMAGFSGCLGVGAAIVVVVLIVSFLLIVIGGGTHG